MRSFNIQNTEINGYRILERIGVGGMGEVYKAFHPGLHRTAAIKILFQKEQAERFKNEAYIQSSVNHPNIARLYEYIPSGNTPCIIMEYVEGVSLDSYIARNRKLNSEETEKILIQIVSALKYLHSKNILHRDIKPQNFKLEKDGTVKMLDFGISKNEYTPKLTQLGFVVGTTEYMAPEQFEHNVEKKSDVWSVGVMTYEMLTGTLPFESNNPISLRNQIVKAKFTNPKILVPQISDKLVDVIDKCLRTHPSGRPSAQELERMLTGKPEEKKQEEKKFILPSPKISIKPRIHLPSVKISALKIPLKRPLIYGSIFVVAAILLIAVFSSRSSGPGPVPKVDSIKPPPVQSAILSKVTIDVNNANDAVVILPDGTEKSLPAELTGKPGDSYNVVLRADGFRDKIIPIGFVQVSKTYTYSLDKKNEY